MIWYTCTINHSREGYIRCTAQMGTCDCVLLTSLHQDELPSRSAADPKTQRHRSWRTSRLVSARDILLFQHHTASRHRTRDQPVHRRARAIILRIPASQQMSTFQDHIREALVMYGVEGGDPIKLTCQRCVFMQVLQIVLAEHASIAQTCFARHIRGCVHHGLAEIKTPALRVGESLSNLSRWDPSPAANIKHLAPVLQAEIARRPTRV